MKSKRILANGPMMAAIGMMAFMPATSWAMIGQNSATAQQACACYTTSLTPGASHLLNDVWRDAEQVARRTDSLENFADSPNIDRSMQDHQLKLVQARVNDMDNRLLRLEGMEQSLPPADQRSVNETISLVQSMANDTKDAISDLDASTQYGGYAQLLNEEANTVAQEINSGEQATDVQQRSAYYQENLGTLPVFGK